MVLVLVLALHSPGPRDCKLRLSLCSLFFSISMSKFYLAVGGQDLFLLFALNIYVISRWTGSSCFWGIIVGTVLGV